jgi:hypothetical protein
MIRYCSIRSVILIVLVLALLLNVIGDFSKSHLKGDFSKFTTDFFHNRKFTFHNIFFTDEVTLLDKRFAELRKLLPANSIIGYISSYKCDSLTETKYYYITQYALSPVIVSRDTNHDFIVAYLYNTIFSEDISNFIILKNFENGVLLLTKKR